MFKNILIFILVLSTPTFSFGNVNFPQNQVVSSIVIRQITTQREENNFSFNDISLRDVQVALIPAALICVSIMGIMIVNAHNRMR